MVFLVGAPEALRSSPSPSSVTLRLALGAGQSPAPGILYIAIHDWLQHDEGLFDPDALLRGVRGARIAFLEHFSGVRAVSARGSADTAA
jgi:hypothetical protein